MAQDDESEEVEFEEMPADGVKKAIAELDSHGWKKVTKAEGTVRSLSPNDMRLTLELHPEGAILRLHLIHAADEQALTFVIAPGSRVFDWVRAVVKAAPAWTVDNYRDQIAPLLDIAPNTFVETPEGLGRVEK